MNLTVYTPNFKLEVLNQSNAPLVVDYLLRNKDFFAPWSPTAPDNFFTTDFQAERLSRQIKDIEAGRSMRFFVFDKHDKNKDFIMGDISFSNIVYGPLQSCFVGYKIDKTCLRMGVGTEIVSYSIQYIFDALSLHRIEANIIPRNIPSIRLVEKIGFRKEGLSRDYLCINGKWEDHYRYVLINDEWEEK